MDNKCVNCSVRVLGGMFKPVGSLDSSAQTILSAWLHPFNVSEASKLCCKCHDILSGLTMEPGNEPPQRILGHKHICYSCGTSILRLQSFPVLENTPEREILLQKIQTHQVPHFTHVCHRCWGKVTRYLQRMETNASPAGMHAEVTDKMEPPNVPEKGNSKQDSEKHSTENIPNKMVDIPIKMEDIDHNATEVPLPIKCELEEVNELAMEPVEVTIKQEEYHVAEEQLQEEVMIKQEVGDGCQEVSVNHEQAPNVDVKEEGECNANRPKVICVVPVIRNLQPPAPALPESILPTNDDYTDPYDHMFSLNSITSDMLPLYEQIPVFMHQQPRATFPCPRCPKLCKSRANLKRHLNVHDTIERRMRSVLKGLQTKRDNKAASLQRQSKKYEAYDEVRGRGEFACSKCSKKYTMKAAVLRHQRHCAGDRDNFKCSLCDKKYRTVVGLGHHEQVCKISRGISIRETPDYTCTCGKVYLRRSRLETCLRAHSEHPNIAVNVTRYQCPMCPVQCATKSAATRHERTHLTPLPVKRYPCKFCPVDYRTPKELFEHLQRHQKLQLVEYKVVSEAVQGRRELDCFMCSSSCADVAELKVHVLEDHKCPYKCPQCARTYLNVEDLTRHIKAAHPATEGQPMLDIIEAASILAQSWKCDECQMQFVQPNLLAIHQAKIHQGLKELPQFQCRYCCRMFPTSKQLSEHLRLVHPFIDKPNGKMEKPLIMCVHCRKTCQDENALASHMRLHSLDRKFVCKFCDFRFATAEKCDEHAVIHTGEMKYVCFICEYRCSSQNRLDMHKQSVKHLRIRDTLLESANVKERDDSMNVKGKDNTVGMSEEVTCSTSECNICGESFASESKMLEHKQTHPFIEFPNEDQPTRIFFK